VQQIRATKNEYESRSELFLYPLKLSCSYTNWHTLRNSEFSFPI